MPAKNLFSELDRDNDGYVWGSIYAIMTQQPFWICSLGFIHVTSIDGLKSNILVICTAIYSFYCEYRWISYQIFWFPQQFIVWRWAYTCYWWYPSIRTILCKATSWLCYYWGTFLASLKNFLHLLSNTDNGRLDYLNLGKSITMFYCINLA